MCCHDDFKEVSGEISGEFRELQRVFMHCIDIEFQRSSSEGYHGVSGNLRGFMVFQWSRRFQGQLLGSQGFIKSMNCV